MTSLSPHRAGWALLMLLLTSPAWGQGGPSLVTVSPVVQRTAVTERTFVGTVLPSRTSVVGSAVDGRVVDYVVREGDFVKKGDVLAEILTGTIKIELAAAQAELKLRQAQLEELQNGSLPEEIDQALAKMKAAKSRTEYTEAKHRRFAMLFERGTITKEEFDESESLAEAASQAFLEAEASWKLVQKGPRAEKIAQSEAMVLSQQEVVNRILDRIEKYTIRAYFDGYVVRELTEVGHWIREGESVAEVVALDEVDVRLPVLEDYVSGLALGSPVSLRIPALGSKATVEGTVHRIVPQADVRSRTFPVDVRVKNTIDDSGPLLKSGLIAEAKLSVEVREALLVSKDAVVFGGPKPMVFVVDLDPKDQTKGQVRPIPVELGTATGGLHQVLAGVKKGELVVVRGNERLRPGQPVKIAETLSAEAQVDKALPKKGP